MLLVLLQLAITNATVVDVRDGSMLPRTTIVIDHGKIVAMGTDGEVVVPVGAERVAGAGKFVVPGLWDMHVHLATAGRGSLATFLRFGITSVRDLGGSLDSVLSWRRAIGDGRVVGPRILAAGPIVENAAWLRRLATLAVPGIKEVAAERIGVDTPEDAKRAVDSIATLGVEVLKLRNAPRPATYVALLEEARRRGLFVAGHQPGAAIGLAGTIAAGQRSIEHMEGLGELLAMPRPRRDSVISALALAEIWVTPTLGASFGRFRPDEVTIARVEGTDPTDPYRDLVTPEMRTFWRQQVDLKQFDAPIDSYRRSVESGLAGMRLVRAGGARLLAGTDLGAPLLYPGASLLDELVLMTDSLGLRPLAAIQAATIEPARYFRMTDSLGTVAVGQLADLILLDADPLADIRNIRKIAAVVSRGRLVPR